MDSSLAVAFAPSPNHGERASGARIRFIVLHYTGLREEALEAWTADPGGEALRWLCAPQSQVSCHYLVERDGRVIQLVAESRRAWHAGRSSWQGCTDLNSHSIGVEIVNAGHAGGLPPYPDAQIDAVAALCREIASRHGIRADGVLAHSDIAPDRKADPGEHFPWAALHRAGVGAWVEPAPLARDVDPAARAQECDAACLQRKLARVGYGLAATGVYDLATEQAVRAFQRRYRPARVDGMADLSTLRTLDALIDQLAIIRRPSEPTPADRN